jgi:hypothetical protein
MPGKNENIARAALVVVMLANREVPNTELVKEHKIKLDPENREWLNKDGLLRTRTENRRLLHKITDEGIEWCMTGLVDSELPPRSGPAARANLLLLRRIVGYLSQRGILADAVRSPRLESLIREVYQDLSVGPQDWIRLARIRPRLNGADKREVDDALLRMMKTGTVHLAPDSNRKVLTEDDHAAAIRIGGVDKHLIAIEES